VKKIRKSIIKPKSRDIIIRDLVMLKIIHFFFWLR